MLKSIRSLQKSISDEGVRIHDIFKSNAIALDKISPLNAVIEKVDPDESCPHTSSIGRLQYASVAVKDNFCVRNTKTTCGSKILSNFESPYTATIVRRALENGAHVACKSSLDEFGMGSTGVNTFSSDTNGAVPCKNIWLSKEVDYELIDSKSGEVLHTNLKNNDKVDPDDFFIAGGSSSGTAVCVASGACMLGIGSDTGGSVRIPAGWCGIPSLKPSYGALSRHGLISLLNSCDVPGLMASNVKDLKVMFDCLHGPDSAHDSTCIGLKPSKKFRPVNNLDDSRLKLGICDDYFIGVSTCVAKLLFGIANLFEKQVDVSLPSSRYAMHSYSILNACEVASNMSRYDGIQYGLRHSNIAQTRTEGFSDAVKSRIVAGNYFLMESNYEKYFEQAMKVRRMICQDFESVFEKVDVLLTPITPDVAPHYSTLTHHDNREDCFLFDHYSQGASLAGLPAVTLPIQVVNGLPVSLQFIGPFGSDKRLLDIAELVEDVVNFPRIRLL